MCRHRCTAYQRRRWEFGRARANRYELKGQVKEKLLDYPHLQNYIPKLPLRRSMVYILRRGIRKQILWVRVSPRGPPPTVRSTHPLTTIDDGRRIQGASPRRDPSPDKLFSRYPRYLPSTVASLLEYTHNPYPSVHTRVQDFHLHLRRSINPHDKPLGFLTEKSWTCVYTCLV